MAEVLIIVSNRSHNGGRTAVLSATDRSSEEAETSSPEPLALSLPSPAVGMENTQGVPESSLRILLVEDDSDQAAFTMAMLQTAWAAGVRLDHTTSVRGAIDRLSDRSYDVALLDLGLPDAQELEALNSLVGAAPHLPLVILTGPENDTLALQAVKNGAQDYLVNGQTTPEVVVRAIRYAIERKQSELHIRHLAYYDSLTQLPNRRLL